MISFHRLKWNADSSYVDKNKVSSKTPMPLAKDLTKKQIKKAIEIKKQNKRIDWLGL